MAARLNSEQPKRLIVIVVPSYNEARQLPDTLRSLCSREAAADLADIGDLSIVLVDDGSRDETGAVARNFPIHYLRHPINLGQGAALETGTRYALGLGADVVVNFDADGQHSIWQLRSIIEPVIRGEAEVVVGSRFLRKGDAEKIPRPKRTLLRGARLISWLLTGIWLTDAHNGLRALSRMAASRIRITESGFAHATEILCQVRQSGLKLREVPTTITYTEYSASKGQPMLNSLNILFDLFLARISR